MKHSPDRLRYVVLALLLATPALAATSPDIGPANGEIDHASLGAPRGDIAVQGPKAVPKPPVSANPLWAIPLNTLMATRERPLFSPSRRAPTPVVANAPAIPRPQPPPPPAVAQHPDMILVGTVTGESSGVAVFIDTTTRDTIRLRAGEDHKGWTLRSVEARSVTLHRGSTTETMVLPPASATAGSTPIVSALPPAPPPVTAQPVGADGPERPVPQPQGCMPDPIGC